MPTFDILPLKEARANSATGQRAVDRGVRLAEDERQLRRVDEGRPAEGVEHLTIG